MNTVLWIIIGVLIVAMIVLVAVLRSVLHRMQAVADQLVSVNERIDEFGPLLADTRSALRKAESRNLRADDLVSVATSVTTRADAASKLAYQVATNPLVRGLAWARGVRRGVGALNSPAKPQLPPKREVRQLPTGRVKKRK